MNNDLILAERRIFYELYSGNSSERPDELENRYFSLKDLLDKDGFLEEVPQNSKVKTISDIAELPGAIIVAEAGMGKTHVMEYLASSVDAGLQQLFYASKYLNDVTSFGNDIKEIDKSVKIILIDGLDENPDAIQTILRTLKKHKQNKKIFLATRGLKTLRSISEDLSLPVYFLLPLSKQLVYDYASHEGVESKSFIKAIIHNGLQPVCSNPLGCNLLIQQYKTNKLRNVSNDSLWKDSILALCAENDSKTKNRNETKDDVTPDECQEEAAKIALILKLSNQSTIEIEQGFYTNNQEKKERLYHYFWRDIPRIKEILSRAIFVPVSDNCFEFAHKTFQDYLAAWGLFHYVQRENWEAILLSSDCHDFYPQWEDVAKFLVSFDDKWRDTVLKKRPDFLLASDLAISNLNHAELIERVFQKLDDYDYWTIHDGRLLSGLCKLNHSEIIPVLKNVLMRDVSLVQKEMALNIIQEDNIQKLEKVLVKVFCDPKESIILRHITGSALEKYATKKSRKECKKVLNEKNIPMGLKAQVFRMTWPDLISTGEITPHLVETDVVDTYAAWISQDFPKILVALTRKQAITFLKWAVSNINKPKSGYDYLLNMRQQIYTICWIKYYDKKTLPLFAEGFYSFSKIWKEPFFNNNIFSSAPKELVYTREDFYKDTKKRQSLARELMKQKNKSETLFIFLTPQLLFFEDIDFIISMIENIDEANNQKDWVKCLCYLRNGILLPKMAEKWNAFHELYPDVFQNDADKEMIIRAEYQKRIQQQKLDAEMEIETKKTKRNIFWDSCRKSLYQNDAKNHLLPMLQYCVEDSHKDMFTYETGKAWNSFSKRDKQRIVALAQEFLIENTSFNREVDRNYPQIPLLFLLIYKEGESVLGDLPQKVWDSYSTDIFESIEYQQKGATIEIVLYMKEHFSDIFYKNLFSFIKDRLDSNRSFHLSLYEFDLDISFLQLIAELCLTAKYDCLTRFYMLKDIQKRDPTILKSLFVDRFPILNTRTKHNSIACNHKSFLDFVDKIGIYSVVLLFDIFPILVRYFYCCINESPEMGKMWFEDLMKIELCEHYVSFSLKKISSKDLAALYIWLASNYMQFDNLQNHSVFSSNVPDSIYIFLDRLINIIMESNQQSVLSSLKMIKRQLPALPGIDNYIKIAKSTKLRLECRSYQCDEIKCILDKNNMSLINSAQDLLHLVYRTLLDYQDFINGKNTPRIEDLWNNLGKEFTPKSEEDFSDHLRSYLEIFLSKFKVVINREVQLNRGSHGKPGARTDIWIETFSDDHPKKISLCIEVKGSWNTEIQDALNTQLIEKYMDNGAADAGIFLVGWFKAKDCSKPIQHCLGKTIEDAQMFLRQQEEYAVKNGYLVKCIVIDCEYRK